MSTPHEVYDQLSEIFYEPFGRLLESFCNATGRTTNITPDVKLFWYRNPGFHIFETILMFFLISWWTYNTAYPYYRRMVYEKPKISKPSCFSDIIVGGILLLCFLSQVIFKAMRPQPFIQLLWICVPCHLITFIWAYILLQPPSAKNYHWCKLIASLLSIACWGGIMASIFPDWSDHQYKIEGVVFYVHHGFLLFIPHYWMARHGMVELSGDGIYNLFMLFFTVGNFINFFVYTPLNYMTGLNVNYNLHPHIGMMKHPIFDTKWYRFLVPSVLTTFGVVYLSIFMPICDWLLNSIVSLLNSVFNKNNDNGNNANSSRKSNNNNNNNNTTSKRRNFSESVFRLRSYSEENDVETKSSNKSNNYNYNRMRGVSESPPPTPPEFNQCKPKKKKY